MDGYACVGVCVYMLVMLSIEVAGHKALIRNRFVFVCSTTTTRYLQSCLHFHCLLHSCSLLYVAFLLNHSYKFPLSLSTFSLYMQYVVLHSWPGSISNRFERMKPPSHPLVPPAPTETI